MTDQNGDKETQDVINALHRAAFNRHHQIEALSRSITAWLPDSSMLKSIDQMQSIFNHHHQIEALSGQLTAGLQYDSVMKSMSQMEALSRSITAWLPDSSMLKSIDQLQSIFNRYNQMETLSRQLTAGLQYDSVMKSMSQMEALSRQLTELHHSSIGQIEALANSARQMAMASQETSAIVAIRELLNTPFNPTLKEIVFNHLDSIEKEQPDFTEYQDFAIDQRVQEELQRELAGNRDYNGLSNRAKLFLSWIFYICFIPIFLNIVSSLVTPYIQKIVQTDLQDKKTPAEIRSYTRKPNPEVIV